MIGYQDGAEGKPPSQVGHYREACAKHGVIPELDSYTAGRQEGLREYCRPDNGFYLGENGYAYRGVCPQGSETGFRRAYGAGREIHRLKSDVRTTEVKIRKKKSELSGLHDSLTTKEAELVGAGVSTERRAQLLIEIFNLSKQVGVAEEDLESLEQSLTTQRTRLDRARTNALQAYSLL
jgi:hypothetical protein